MCSSSFCSSALCVNCGEQKCALNFSCVCVNWSELIPRCYFIFFVLPCTTTTITITIITTTNDNIIATPVYNTISYYAIRVFPYHLLLNTTF